MLTGHYHERGVRATRNEPERCAPARVAFGVGRGDLLLVADLAELAFDGGFLFGTRLLTGIATIRAGAGGTCLLVHGGADPRERLRHVLVGGREPLDVPPGVLPRIP